MSAARTPGTGRTAAAADTDVTAGAPQAAATCLSALVAAAAARLGAGEAVARLEAEVLLAHALGRPRSFLRAHGDETPEAGARARFDRLVARRAAGEPVAYLTGTREFWSLELRVTPDTLIPRPDTERLVELALAWLPPGRGSAVADLGTGCGAIALALAHARPDLRLVATDRSPAALEVARANARRLGIRNVEFRLGDWCAALDGERFALLVTNPPYVAAADPHLRAGDVRFEPRVALAAGRDGLDAARRLASQARRHLLPGGRLALEHGHQQQDAVMALLRRHGYHDVQGFRDDAGNPRVATGLRAGSD